MRLLEQAKTPEQSKELATALHELKSSSQWKLLDLELAARQEELERTVFDQSIDHESKKLAIDRRNVVKLFRELPDDLIATLVAPM